MNVQTRNKSRSVLSSKAVEVETTQLVIGQSKLTFWEELRRGSVIKQLIRLTRHMDVLIVADFDPNIASIINGIYSL